MPNWRIVSRIFARCLLFFSMAIAPQFVQALVHDFPPAGGNWRSLVPGTGVTPNQAGRDNIRATVGLDWDYLKIASDYSKQFDGTSSLIVIRDDWIAFEWGDTTSKTGAASVTKSLTGIAAARVFDMSSSGQLAGAITPDSLAKDYLPSTWNQGNSRRNQVSVRQLLTMSSGIAPWDAPNDPLYTQSFILDRGIESTPGSVWSYSSLSADLAGIVLQNAAAGSIETIMQRDILGPIGADVSWEQIAGSGLTKGSSGARLSTRSLARIAHLLLHEGEWAGQQLISAQNGRLSATGRRSCNQQALPTRWAHPSWCRATRRNIMVICSGPIVIIRHWDPRRPRMLSTPTVMAKT